MIDLKEKINKSEFIKTMKQKANEIYQYSYEPEMNIDAFMYGVRLTLKELQIKKDNENDRQQN